MRSVEEKVRTRTGGMGAPNLSQRSAKGHSEQVDAGATPRLTRETRALPSGLEKRVLESRLKRAGFSVADSKLRTDFELCGAMDFQIGPSVLRQRCPHSCERECGCIAVA